MKGEPDYRVKRSTVTCENVSKYDTTCLNSAEIQKKVRAEQVQE